MPDQSRNTFGNLLKQFRQQAKLSQNDLARAAGLDPTSLNRIENAEEGRPRLSTITRLTYAFGWSRSHQNTELLLKAAGYTVADSGDSHTDRETLRRMLVRGVPEFNRWRASHEDHTLDLDFSETDLHSMDLRTADFRRMNLSRANLQKTDLARANFRDANLQGANLSLADLRGALLRNADLTDADLSGADFSGAYLHGAKLEGANLQKADGRGADLRGSNLRSADLRKADLRRADLSNADLSFASLVDTNLVKAELRDANFAGVDLSRAEFRPIELFESDTRNARLPESYQKAEAAAQHPASRTASARSRLTIHPVPMTNRSDKADEE